MTNQTKKVLSIDGGGIRGAAAARFLKRLDDALFEKEKKRLRDLVDLYAGTSTGAIIALALANTNLTMDTISDLYSVKVARNIFKSNRGCSKLMVSTRRNMKAKEKQKPSTNILAECV
ncbi:patatin-like phospholipase family protein [Enterovibrio coralii]|uniref:patatin-like phospholipase family protein n=1 Tax=Enterovibrio coralii TaxID=294935 RepID=UPI000AB80F64|nr:patatin-like phospholipase family protein [Enterovibrio coralii]